MRVGGDGNGDRDGDGGMDLGGGVVQFKYI